METYPKKKTFNLTPGTGRYKRCGLIIFLPSCRFDYGEMKPCNSLCKTNILHNKIGHNLKSQCKHSLCSKA